MKFIEHFVYIVLFIVKMGLSARAQQLSTEFSCYTDVGINHWCQ